MGYRAVLQASPETVQDLEISALYRLTDAKALHDARRYHAAIYVAGLSAEMYLKTACFFLGGAKPADPVDALRAALAPRSGRPPLSPSRYESGHGISFWSDVIILRRTKRGLPQAPVPFRQVITNIESDWFIEMRYRPGSATVGVAARFITQVEWLANNHSELRR